MGKRKGKTQKAKVLAITIHLGVANTSKFSNDCHKFDMRFQIFEVNLNNYGIRKSNTSFLTASSFARKLTANRPSSFALCVLPFHFNNQSQVYL